MKTTASDASLLVGLSEPDDAAVYRVTEDVALVQTVDFFTPIVDDPFDWGRIAAANALSDVYAMGGDPKTALNLVGWPRGLGFELLGRVLEGSGSICEDAGVAVVGGHSVDDPEPKFGLAVTGTVHPDRIVRKTGAGPGDHLVLTKALGTGVISSALKEGAAARDVVAIAVESMVTLNAGASKAMLEAGAVAATDVTGFGLVGHLKEMLGTDLDAELQIGSIPFLPGASELAERGNLPGGSKRNAGSAAGFVDVDGSIDPGRRALLFDAQTSGGLLIAVDDAGLGDLLGALERNGSPIHARIGRLTRGSGRVRVVA